MKTIKFYSIGLIAIVIFTFSQQTFAQLVNFYGSQGWVNTIAQIQESQLIKNALGMNKSKGSSGSSKSTSSNRTEKYEIPAYRRYPAVQFKPTGTRLILQEYLDKVNANPQDKAELKQLILKISKEYETAAAAKGYPNDWALAFVSYIAINSRIYHGETEKSIIPFEQNIGLRDIIAESVTKNGTFKKVTDREKQELYELAIIGGAVTSHYYEKAVKEKNVQELKDFKVIAEQNLKAVGIEP